MKNNDKLGGIDCLVFWRPVNEINYVSISKDELTSICPGDKIEKLEKVREKNHGILDTIVSMINQKDVTLVKDSGIGIPKDDLNEIFKPLFTTKLEGTGLGLASVHSIIDLHNGTISVSSPPTVFTITLPKN